MRACICALVQLAHTRRGERGRLNFKAKRTYGINFAYVYLLHSRFPTLRQCACRRSLRGTGGQYRARGKIMIREHHANIASWSCMPMLQLPLPLLDNDPGGIATRATLAYAHAYICMHILPDVGLQVASARESVCACLCGLRPCAASGRVRLSCMCASRCGPLDLNHRLLLRASAPLLGLLRLL